MRWRTQDLNRWHRWYAWHPVCADTGWIWLDYVTRRLVAGEVWEYEDTI